ncbi:signal recognition particle protein, partial [Pediococcus acidilactici]|nr:signal recognition particle protein [Pediococcus acidilactici]
DKAQKEFDEKQAAEMSQKKRENTFEFNDFLDQMKQVQSMGPIEDIVKMIPGMANNPALKNINVDPKDIEHTKAIVYSMTKQERENPDILNPSRRRRIAAGSGRKVIEVFQLIKKYKHKKKIVDH